MSGLEIQPISLRSASEREYACLNAFGNLLRGEMLPEDPPIPCDEDIQRWRTLPAFQKEAVWAVWDESQKRIIARAEAMVWYTGDNEHLAEFVIGVLPTHRRQGIGRRLLRPIVEFARGHERRLLICETNDRVPAGAAFLTRLGAQAGLVSRVQQLRMAELNQGLIEDWLARADSLREEFEAELWTGAYPEEQIAAIAQLIEEIAKDEPREELEVEDQKFTPDTLRQWEANMFAGGARRWTVMIVRRADRSLAGLTEVVWNPNRPTILNQYFTGVLAAFRNRGLGRWLKAEMMTRILRDRPEVEVVRTGNADSNAPMRRINDEMGYRPFFAETFWQVDTEVVAGYSATE